MACVREDAGIVSALANSMDSQENDFPSGGRDPAGSAQQQEHPGDHEGHAGQGADSAMKQLREWEQHRANNSAGKGHQGPN